MFYKVVVVRKRKLCQCTERNSVKPILVATSIKQATYIKQAYIQLPQQANKLKGTCIKQAPVLILVIPEVLAKYKLDCN